MDYEIKNPKSFVYFIQLGINGPIKIGYTENLVKRLTSIQSNTPFCKINVISSIAGNKEVEKYFHEKYKEYKLQGEWFVPSIKQNILNDISRKQGTKMIEKLSEKETNIEETILNELERGPMTQNDIYELFNRNVRASEYKKVLYDLMEKGLVHFYKDKNTQGRPKTFWFKKV